MPDDNSSVPCSVVDERSPESGILDGKLSSEFSDQPNLNVPMAASVHCKSSSENLFHLTKLRETPLIVLDLDRIDRNVAQIRTAFTGVALFYALKCNPHTAIVERLQSLNVGFEIASPAELRTMLSLGVVADQLACFHTIKSSAFLRQLDAAGVRLLAVDSFEELHRIAQYAPNAEVMVRIDPETQNSQYPLNGKFGCSPIMAGELLKAARLIKLRTAGITMHVGSQCACLDDWHRATTACVDVLRNAAEAGIEVSVLSLGGGLPVKYTTAIQSLDSIGQTVSSAISTIALDIPLKAMIEPGRAIVASAGTLISTVLGVAKRGDQHWVYLDAGVFHGLFEKLQVSGGFILPVDCESNGRPLRRCRLAGPTCDSMDVFPGTYDLPELQPGDRVAFRMAGAYSSSLTTQFNGFPAPTTVLLSEL